jgi:hypothetical protein
METYEFLKDVKELEFFWKYGVPNLQPNEVYFMSTSARNKRLTEEERQYYQVGRSEMFHKEIVKDDSWESFIKAIHRCESNKLAYLTKAGMPYPDKVLVLYWNINPTDAYKAMLDQIDGLINVQRELTDSVLKNSQAGIESAWKNVRSSHTTGQSVFARTFGTKTWIDIDCDMEMTNKLVIYEQLNHIRHWLEQHHVTRGNCMIVETSGGFHFLIKADVLPLLGKEFKTNPVKEIIEIIEEHFTYHYINNGTALVNTGIKINEVVQNNNFMIPLVGTLQYGDHIVRVVNKDDFEDKDISHE